MRQKSNSTPASSETLVRRPKISFYSGRRSTWLALAARSRELRIDQAFV